MKCEQCLSVIDEYVEAELDEQISREVLGHLTSCRSCATECKRLEREQEIYALYLKEIEASPALWLNLKSDMIKDRAPGVLMYLKRWVAVQFGSPNPGLALALALMIVVIAITLVVKRLNPSLETARSGEAESAALTSDQTTGAGVTSGEGTKVETSVADDKTSQKKSAVRLATRSHTRRYEPERMTARDHIRTPEEIVESAERKYLTAVMTLSRDLKLRSKASPEIQGRFKEILASIDRTILQTRQVVRKQRNDPVAVQYLLAAYAKKLDVLKEMANS